MTTTKKVCPTHNEPLIYSREQKKHYCKTCLYGAYLTYQTQQAAVKRYRQSEKGRAAEKRYETSERGKTARDRYLKSEKYKQRRAEYNERLKESLRIARQAHLERAVKHTEVETQRDEGLLSLVQDIQEYFDTFNTPPSTAIVIRWAKSAHKLDISPNKAAELITKALKRRHG